ncbi:uncharacterized protein HD556DRAFT_1407068 [Suillus plorans]|uniref:Uncharacterized protein n=1 Tax=Suillus plorans TaxID=116603 RepID=A0A9P7AFN3_9AGAM|nr:uncharacterized protein HD556DRAFT_1407068 [Suillus plorans]KAG1787840.1 hypothetical protein HD556DRAFT_1407068 [Suillus plorans]
MFPTKCFIPLILACLLHVSFALPVSLSLVLHFSARTDTLKQMLKIEARETAVAPVTDQFGGGGGGSGADW